MLHRSSYKVPQGIVLPVLSYIICKVPQAIDLPVLSYLAINDGCTPKWGTFKSMYPIGVQLGYNWGNNQFLDI